MQDFEELQRLQKIGLNSSFVKVETLEEVRSKGKTFPILSFSIGPNDPSLPTFGLFAGVHGLEKVGTHVSLYYLESLLQQLKWDKDLQKTFESMRLVSIPMINPIGVYFKTRSNGNSVDLMRNSPIVSKEKVPFLVGGHRYSKQLPWYQGDSNSMEKESLCLIEFVKKQMFSSRFSMALDVHSGFGLKDRLWYPYAKTKTDFPLKSTAVAFADLLQKTHPFHIYKVEPQSLSYTTHGDLWDYMFDLQHASHPQNTFIPWCLEMGSWTWVRKNPLQVFSSHGVFHPIKTHRYQRTMRRHYNLLDLFHRACHNYSNWSPT